MILGENKNLKDTSKDSFKDTFSVPISTSNKQEQSVSLVSSWQNYSGSYTKTNKLVTALYMVTDIMEKGEPIRLKLRTLGVEILSDIAFLEKGTFGNIKDKVISILSFLNIASDLGMISGMNSTILKKEFTGLKQSIEEFTNKNNLWFEEFMSDNSKEELNDSVSSPLVSKIDFSIGHSKLNDKKDVSFAKGQSVRIGVQKGSTLLKALSNVKGNSINKNASSEGFEMLKKDRRESIIKITKSIPNGVSIKDIVTRLDNTGKKYGEKTIQRELVSMVKDNVLKKTGEKRWSKYSINN
ncbi:TPA: hypothetical protein DD445_01480 [Candidatus Nomurabacteria bacterium]|nr:hypothetical protein [Candidatus Nomurabacteria bacterium]HBP27446.1 hypothetical protein [Candidatus Nomurabacteria bacterium]HBR65949.1 hypothetical protein [Candidatus Nomurabacteria bacterium]HCU46997.1 hypothetical protein [Candidatus Nomurabacteria bacterium]